MTHAARTPDQPSSSHRARPAGIVRSVIGWVVENDRQFRAAQSMLDQDERRY